MKPSNQDLELVDGPPIVDVVTSFDEALSCMQGRISPQLTFAVGQIPDNTGKEQHNDGGTGRFVTQGASDIVQSALFKTGVTLLNRRELGIIVGESQWGIRDLRAMTPTNFYISGSINSLDFIPGGGSFLSVGGVGPRYRQNRILIALDLTVTNTQNGQIVASIPLQKQIFADELGITSARIFGTTLIDFDAGAQQREAVNFALRQMLYLATFELLSQMMPARVVEECRNMFDETMGSIEGERTSAQGAAKLREARAAFEARKRAAEEAAAQEAAAEAAPAEEAADQEAAAQDAAAQDAQTEQAAAVEAVVEDAEAEQVTAAGAVVKDAEAEQVTAAEVVVEDAEAEQVTAAEVVVEVAQAEQVAEPAKRAVLMATPVAETDRESDVMLQAESGDRPILIQSEI